MFELFQESSETLYDEADNLSKSLDLSWRHRIREESRYSYQPTFLIYKGGFHLFIYKHRSDRVLYHIEGALIAASLVLS